MKRGALRTRNLLPVRLAFLFPLDGTAHPIDRQKYAPSWKRPKCSQHLRSHTFLRQPSTGSGQVSGLEQPKQHNAWARRRKRGPRRTSGAQQIHARHDDLSTHILPEKNPGPDLAMAEAACKTPQCGEICSYQLILDTSPIRTVRPRAGTPTDFLLVLSFVAA